jgi:ketosteroid isomerase-like protein
MEPTASRRTIQLYTSSTDQSAAARALIRSYPLTHRYLRGFSVYVASSPNCSIRSLRLILFSLDLSIPMISSRCLLFAAIPFIFLSCSQRHFDPTTEGEKLLRRDAEWADLAAAGKDVDKVVSYWSDDAVLIFPGQPTLEGKAAIRAYVTACFQTPGFNIHWVSEKPTFSPDGKFAYMRGADEATVPGPGGALMILHSRGVSIWRLDSDGQWRCVVDISNEAPSATPKS